MEKEDFGYGVTLHWMGNGQIAVIETQGDMSREAIDVWADLVIRLLHQGQSDDSIFMLQDLSHKNQGVTPYGMKRNKDIQRHLSRRGAVYMAIVFRNPMLVKMAFSLIRRGTGFPENVEVKIVGTQAEGLVWLEAQRAVYDYEAGTEE